MTNNTEQTYGEQIDSKQALRNCSDKLDKLTALAEEWIGAPEVIDQINQIAWGIKSDALEAGEAIGLRSAQRQAQEAAQPEAYTFDTILAAGPDTNIPKAEAQPAAPANKRDYVSVYDALCHAEAAAEKSALCLGEFINQIFEDPLIDKENIGYHVGRLRPFVEIAFDCAADSRKECHEVLEAARS